MPKYKLIYFDFPALGEPIRWLLCILGEEFEDKRIPAQEWPSFKPRTPYGKLPILEVDGEQLIQSSAICRFLAKKAGLAGADQWEALQIDMAADIVKDIRDAFANAKYEPNEETKAKKFEVLKKETFPFYLERLDALVKKNGGYVANGKLSWGDIFAVAYLDGLKIMMAIDPIKGYENLERLRDTVLSIPQIEKWVESHSKPV